MANPIAAEHLRQVIATVLTKRGAEEHEAATVADVLVDADLRGVDSHGCALLPFYLQLIDRGFLNLRPQLRVVKDAPCTATIDCDLAFGAVAGTKAMALALEKATNSGVGCVVARDLSHTGMSGYYAAQATDAGMIGIFMNNGPRTMPAFGGAERVMSTNPFAVGIPSSSGEPLLLDMATSAVALAQVFKARRDGTTIPSGWGLDASGVPTEDPVAVLTGGFVQWAAAHKGFGLAIMIEILSGVLAEGHFGAAMPDLFPVGETPVRHNAFCLAIDPTRFLAREAFDEKVQRLRDDVKGSKRAAGSR